MEENATKKDALAEAEKRIEALANRVEELAKEKDKEDKDAVDTIAAGGMTDAPNVHTGRQSSIEQKAKGYFGVSSAKQLIKINTADARYRHVPEEVKGAVRELKESIDIGRFIAQAFHGGSMDKIGSTEATDRTGYVKGILDTHYGKDLAARIKAFDTTTNADWVPTGVSDSFIEEYQLDRMVEQRFRTLNPPTNPWKLSVQSDKTEAKTVAEGAQATEDSFGTEAITFDATKLYELYQLPTELTEDSAPDIMGLARMDVMNAIGRAVEQAIINGDDSGTHQDSDTDAGAANLAAKAWKGLRKLALDNSANGSTVDLGNADITEAKLSEMRRAMGKFGVNVRELCYKVDPIVYNQLLQLTNVRTIDAFGPQATILQGALAAYEGIPIVISEFLRSDLNATGVHDGITTDRGGMLLSNHRRFYNAVRRPVQVRLVQGPGADFDRMQIAAYTRRDFQGHTQDSSEVSVVYGFNAKTT